MWRTHKQKENTNQNTQKKEKFEIGGNKKKIRTKIHKDKEKQTQKKQIKGVIISKREF